MSLLQRPNKKEKLFIYIFGNKTISSTILELLISLATSLILSTPYAWKTVFQKFRNFYLFLTLKKINLTGFLMSTVFKDDFFFGWQKLGDFWGLRNHFSVFFFWSNVQEHFPAIVLRKTYSENIQQIYKGKPISKCNINKVAKQLKFVYIEKTALLEQGYLLDQCSNHFI